MSDKLKYDLRGVSASKDEVHAAIKGLDKGLYEKAFCKILPDFAAGDAEYCNIMHADTAGTKTSLAYMYWKTTGDLHPRLEVRIRRVFRVRPGNNLNRFVEHLSA